jgi:hypothetical protein
MIRSYVAKALLGLLAAVALSTSAKSQSDEKCKDVLSCAQLAAESAARAEAAVSAMRRPPVINNVTGARAFGTVYQNASNRTKLVIVTGLNEVAYISMFANVAAAPDALPSGKIGKYNTTTLVGTTFPGALKQVSSFTFVVPPNSYYNVTTNGDDINVLLWIEVDL